MTIAVVKPDHGVAGGFEYLLGRLLDSLGDAGHDVTTVAIPGRQLPRPIWGQHDAASRWFDHPDYFSYLAMVHDTRRLDLSAFDLVISTQPPSYLAPHDRILGLFYHQARIFYELADAYAAGGFVDPATHAAAATNVRSVDDAHRGGVVRWLAGSHECANRLRDTWAIDEAIDILDAPPLSEPPQDVPTWTSAGGVLCVGRQEWPKRAELVVAAAHLHGYSTTIVGDGGRLESLRSLDRRLAAGELDPSGPLGELDAVGGSPHAASAIAASARRLIRRSTPSSPVTIAGRVDADRRNRAYADTSIVVAPALREDYGLTALEAMAWGKPVIVCRDGGGLVEIVESTGAGLVVEPTAGAIADGVERILGDEALALELHDRACAVRSSHTWDRANEQLLAAVEAALDD